MLNKFKFLSMKNVFILFFKILNVYKKKLFKILVYEIYFLIKYFKTGNLIKFRNDNIMTETIPCPYYFIYKISQFINKEKITSVIDLGSGYGRITNFLSGTTKATILGYELDKEVFDISKKNKKNNINIENKNIINVNYKNLNVECFILNDPLRRKTDLEHLIKKIQISRMNSAKKYYLITINIEREKAYIFNNYKLLKLVFAGQSRFVNFFSD